MGWCINASGHVETGADSEIHVARQDDEVDPAAVLTTVDRGVFLILPFEGVLAGSHGILSSRPSHIARPVVLFLVVNVEIHLVVSRFGRHLIIESDGVGSTNFKGHDQRSLLAVADIA